MNADDRSRMRLATSAASKVAGKEPVTLRRFSTGTGHYDFEAMFVDHPPLGVRIGHPSCRTAMEAGLQLHKRLRSMGVRLPGIIAEDLKQMWPCVVLERLDGAGLGHVISGLSNAALDNIAASAALERP